MLPLNRSGIGCLHQFWNRCGQFAVGFRHVRARRSWFRQTFLSGNGKIENHCGGYKSAQRVC